MNSAHSALLIIVRCVITFLIVLCLLIGGCLFVTGCTVIPRECDSGYSWRGDCSQQLFKE